MQYQLLPELQYSGYMLVYAVCQKGIASSINSRCRIIPMSLQGPTNNVLMQSAVWNGAVLGACIRKRVSPVGVLSFLEDVVWRHAQHVHNAHQQIMLRSSRKQGQTQEQLGSHAA